MTTRAVPPGEACRFLLEAPVIGPKRSPKDPFDFGDDDTVGACVKKVGKTFYELGLGDLGFYLGLSERTKKYIVGLRSNVPGIPLAGAIEFDSLEELKCEWMLD